MGYGRLNANDAVDLAGEWTTRYRFTLRDSNDNELASFDYHGNLLLKGGLKENATTAQLNPTTAKEFIVRDSSSNEVARLDDNGDLYIKGDLTEWEATPTPTNPALIIKSGSTNVAYIDSNADLVLCRAMVTLGDPDRDPLYWP